MDLDWNEVAAVVEDAWRLVATKSHLTERNEALPRPDPRP